MSQPFDVNSSTSRDPGGNAEETRFVERNWSGDEFRQVVESAPDALVLVDDQGQIALVNVRSEQLFGYDRDEILDQPVELLMPERFRDRHREYLIDYLSDPRPRPMAAGMNLYGRHKNGSEFPVEISLSPVKTADGMMVSSAIRDLSERKKAAAAVNEARILAQAIVETVREPLLILDENLFVQSANQSFYRTFAVTPQENEHQLVYELGNKQWDIPQLRYLLENVLPDERQFDDFEVQHVFERIGQRTMLLNARRLDREGARESLILLAIEDITDRKRAEDLVEHLSNVPEENPNPIVEIDLAGNVTYLNPAAHNQLPDLVTKSLRHPFLSGLTPLIAALKKSDTDSFVREVDVGDSIFEQKTHVGDTIRIFANNITKRKRALKELKRTAAALQKYNQELERSNRELQDFAYVVSHDLRSPLVNLQGFSHELALSCGQLRSLLANAQVPEPHRRELTVLLEEDIPEALEFIMANATRMDGLLSGILQLSRVGQAALTIRPQDMNRMLSEIVASRQFAVNQAGASIQLDSLPTCQADETQINQVFSNLLDNALKYLDPNRPGVIRICGREEPDRVVYSIEDNGIGIAVEHQDSIYKVFHRLNPQYGTGDGLGLTIVRRILDRHGGKIWVESKVNQGSKFYLSLPTDSVPQNG